MIVAEKKEKETGTNKWDFKTPSNQPVTSTEDKYTNRLIDAYLKGINIGQKRAETELKTKLLKEYQTNIEKAKSAAEDFYSYINDTKKLKCSVVYLKMNSVDSFNLLFIIDEQSYLSEKFDAVYKRSIRQRKTMNNDKFHLSLMFIPQVKTLDKNKIVTDGYTHNYAKTRK